MIVSRVDPSQLVELIALPSIEFANTLISARPEMMRSRYLIVQTSNQAYTSLALDPLENQHDYL